MKQTATILIVALCVICAATMMAGCLEVDDPVNADTGTETVSANDAKTEIAHALSESDSPTPTPTTLELYYDSDSIEGWRSMGNGIFPTSDSDGGNVNGFGMRFTTPNNQAFAIESIKISGSRYGSDCNMRIEVWDYYKNVQYSNVMKHSDMFTTSDSWRTTSIPNIIVSGDFYIVLFTDSINPNKSPTTGIKVNIGTPSETGRMYIVNQKNMESENGVWMMRVVGISSEESVDRTPTPLPTPIPTVPTTLELSIGHTAFNSETEITVISVHKKYYYDWKGMSGNMYSEEADHGNTFVFASVNMKNVGRDRDYLGSYDLSITDSKGFRYDRSYMSGDNNELDSYQELYQNQQMEGIVMFEVPKDAVGLKIQYDFGNMFGRTQIASWEIPDRS